MKSQTSLSKSWQTYKPASFILRAALSASRPRNQDEIWDWAESQQFQTEGNRFRISQTPYLREPLQAWKDPTVKTIVEAAPAQSAKTTMGEVVMCHASAEESGNILFYAASQTDVDDFADTRMENHYKRVPRMKDIVSPDNNKNKKRLKIHRDGSWLSMLSAHTRKRLQSRTAKFVVGDEPSQWPEGHIEEARKRTTRFDRTSSKQLFISTPETMYLPCKHGDDPTPSSFYSIFLEGTQEEWGITCPDCKKWTSMGLKNFVWTDPETKEEPKDESGKWDFEAVANNLRWQCANEDCGCTMRDEPRTRSYITNNGSYKAMNPEAFTRGSRITRSFHWTGFAVPWIEWFGIVESFINAQDMAKRGNTLPLKEVVRKKLGEFWKETEHSAREMVITGGYAGELDKHKRIWRAEPWEKCHTGPNGVALRFLTVDVQKSNFWVCIREWSADGSSQLRAVGDVDTWEEISQFAAEFGIPPACVFVDSGWKRYGGSSKENEVYRECYKRKWWALKGMDKDSWPWASKKNGRSMRPMSPPDYRDGGQGTKMGGRTGARKFFMMFSNPTLKDHLHLLKTGEADAYFGVGANVPDWYIDHMESETKSADTGRWEAIGANHIWDCEVMQLVPAYLYGLFGGE